MVFFFIVLIVSFNKTVIIINNYFSPQGYAPACHCDGFVEVVGLQGVMHLVNVLLSCANLFQKILILLLGLDFIQAVISLKVMV